MIYKPGFERLMTMKSFGERARVRREKLKLSQEKVGEECNVSQEAIRQMEAGMLQRVPRYIDNLVKILDTNKEWLINGTGSVENIVNDQSPPMPRALIDHTYTCADLEKAYKSAIPIEREKFDAMYPVLQKEMREVTEKTAENGFTLQAKTNDKKN